jgi:hypothetical protein
MDGWMDGWMDGRAAESIAFLPYNFWEGPRNNKANEPIQI